MVKGRAPILFGYMLFLGIVGGLALLVLLLPVFLAAGTADKQLLSSYLTSNLVAGLYKLAIGEVFATFGFIYMAKLYFAFEVTKPAMPAAPKVKA